MPKFVVILFVIYLKTNIMTASSRSADADMFHQTNDKILEIMDNLFICLKISKNFTITKYAEEYTTHSLKQDAICNNHKIYKKVRDISKTKISNKTAYYISNINEVIEEMIRSEAVRNYKIRNDSNISTLEDKTVNDFVHLARRFNLIFKTLASTITVPKLKGSKANSQEEGRRIFEGSSTGIAQYPFMASVHVAGRFVCAGSLLHESVALSAASCLMRTENTKSHIHIRVASDYVRKMGSLVNIEELIFHPQFDRTSLENNLVLLQTRKALRFRKQLVVAIQYDRMDASVLRPDVEDLVILGWGRRRTDGIDVPEEDRPLSEGHLRLYDFKACQYIYTRDFVTDKSFCAGFVDRGAGACNHDAGGPALVNNVLVGVISFGSPHCGAAEAPTVFTRLGLYADWIDGVLRKLVETPEINPQEQINISDNNLKEEASDLDQAIRNVYKENFNIDEVLYGPIEMLYHDEVTVIPPQPMLREYPTDPKLFPNPNLVANIASPKTPKPIEIPVGYWRDSSIEQTPTEDYKLPADQFGNGSRSILYSKFYPTTNQVTEKIENSYDVQDIYAENDVVSTIKTEIRVNQFYDPDAFYEEVTSEFFLDPIKKTDSVLRDSFSSNTTVRYTEPPSARYTRLLPSANAITYKPNKSKPTKAKIEHEVNEKAVIMLKDSGTTQIIKVDRKDPLYQGGFKMLAAKILRGNGVQT